MSLDIYVDTFILAPGKSGVEVGCQTFGNTTQGIPGIRAASAVRFGAGALKKASEELPPVLGELEVIDYVDRRFRRPGATLPTEVSRTHPAGVHPDEDSTKARPVRIKATVYENRGSGSVQAALFLAEPYFFQKAKDKAGLAVQTMSGEDALQEVQRIFSVDANLTSLILDGQETIRVGGVQTATPDSCGKSNWPPLCHTFEWRWGGVDLDGQPVFGRPENKCESVCPVEKRCEQCKQYLIVVSKDGDGNIMPLGRMVIDDTEINDPYIPVVIDRAPVETRKKK